MTLYRLNVHETLVESGAMTTMSKGEPVDVGGEPMVRLDHGTIVKREGFHESQAAALRDAVTRIEALATSLIKQSWRLAREAATHE